MSTTEASFLSQRLSQTVFSGLFTLYLIIFVGIACVSSLYQYTPFASTPPGSLVSQMFNRDFVFTWFLCLYFYVPFGMAWTCIFPFKTKVRQTHTVLLILLILLQLIGLGFWCNDYTNRNATTADGANNAFSSAYRCCAAEVIAAAPNNGCGNNVGPCVPGLVSSQLGDNPWGLWKFVVAWITWVITVVHILVYSFAFVPVALNYRQEMQQQPLLEQTGSAYRGRLSRV